MLQFDNFSLKINVTGLLLIQFVASRNLFLYYEFLIHFYNKFEAQFYLKKSFITPTNFDNTQLYEIVLIFFISVVILEELNIFIKFIIQVILCNMILQHSVQNKMYLRIIKLILFAVGLLAKSTPEILFIEFLECPQSLIIL